MASFSLSRTLYYFKLDTLIAPNVAIEAINTIALDALEFYLDEGVYLEGDVSETKSTIKYNNPGYSGYYGDYELTGSTSYVYNSEGVLISSTSNYTKMVANTGNGITTVTGNIKDNYQYNPTKDTESRTSSYRITGISHLSENGSTWSMKLSASYSYDHVKDKESFSSTITSFSTKNNSGDAVVYSGRYTWDPKIGEYTGKMSSIEVTISNTKYIASKLDISYEEISSADYLVPNFSDLLSNILSGNDTITISSTDPLNDGSMIRGYSGNDKIIGGDGYDIIYGDLNRTANDYALIKGNDTLLGGLSDDSVWGGYGNDSIDGGKGDDLLYGDEGNDKLLGGEGDDSIYANNGGSDTLTGGAGKDIFYIELENISQNGKVSITDFDINADSLRVFIGENIFLTTDNFISAPRQTSSTHSSIYFIYDSSVGKLYYDSDANGANTGVLIATITGKPDITHCIPSPVG